MLDIREFQPTNESPVNIALMELIAFFSAAVDKANVKLFETVREGNAIDADIMPRDNEGVCLRIFRVKSAPVIDVQPNMIFIRKQILCIAPCFELAVSQDITEVPGFGGIEPIDYYRENLRRQTQKVLENPSITANSEGVGLPLKWWFGKQEEELEAEANYLMDFEKIKVMRPGWYSSPFLKVLYVDVR